MTIPSNQRRHLEAVFLLFLAAACTNEPTRPQFGFVQVSAKTSGGDFDPDGYEVIVDSGSRYVVRPNASIGLSLRTGTHSLTLASVAENCALSGAQPRSVTVTTGRQVDVVFEIACVATAIVVTTIATGTDVQKTYQVMVSGQSNALVAANKSVVVGRLQPGSYTVALVPFGDNCRVVSANQITVQVTARTTTPVVFEVSCVSPIRLRKIAFVVDSLINGSRQQWIGLINVDGSGGVTLARGSSPAWSPDGIKLVFSDAQCSSDFYYYYDVCTGGLVVMDPETRNVDTLSAGTAGFSPAWAPTGDAIAFLRCCDRNGEPGALYMLKLDVSTAVPLSVPAFTSVYQPDWSPDGRRIAFTCTVAFSRYDLCLVDRDGSKFVRLTNDTTPGIDPAWRPDGKQIAFTTNKQVALLTLDGGAVARLTEGSQPAWSPDGAALVFAGGDGLYTTSIDGSNRRRLTFGNHYAPAWRP